MSESMVWYAAMYCAIIKGWLNIRCTKCIYLVITKPNFFAYKYFINATFNYACLMVKRHDTHINTGQSVLYSWSFVSHSSSLVVSGYSALHTLFAIQ